MLNCYRRFMALATVLSLPSLAPCFTPHASDYCQGRRKTIALPSSTTDGTTMMADLLKGDLIGLASRTNRGFQASADDRKLANKLIEELSTLNPTPEPAKSYYENSGSFSDAASADLAGKWTLIYTDAPDITTLENTPTAKLGRVGQECDPPYIKNVIEWKRPEWAASLPSFLIGSSSDNARILQKVVTKGKVDPSNPLDLNLDLVGFELKSDAGGESVASDDLPSAVQSLGLPAGLLSQNPVNLQGPLTAPFGKAKILYLDENLRIIRTYQNYVAVNTRQTPDDEWF